MENAVAEIERLVPPATNLHPQYSVRSGDVAEQLLRVAKLETADLVVMGCRKRGHDRSSSLDDDISDHPDSALSSSNRSACFALKSIKSLNEIAFSDTKFLQLRIQGCPF